MSWIEYISAKYEIISTSSFLWKMKNMFIFHVFLPEKWIKSQNKINVYNVQCTMLIVNKQPQCIFKKYIIWLENARPLTSKIVYFKFLFFWNGYHGNKKYNMVTPVFYSSNVFRISYFIRFLFPVFKIWNAIVSL